MNLHLKNNYHLISLSYLGLVSIHKQWRIMIEVIFKTTTNWKSEETNTGKENPTRKRIPNQRQLLLTHPTRFKFGRALVFLARLNVQIPLGHIDWHFLSKREHLVIDFITEKKIVCSFGNESLLRVCLQIPSKNKTWTYLVFIWTRIGSKSRLNPMQPLWNWR